MSKDFEYGNIKIFPKTNLDLPSFVDNSSANNASVHSVEGTNVVRVPFGKRFSKKQRPDKNQKIAPLILPMSSYGNPTPPHVA